MISRSSGSGKVYGKVDEVRLYNRVLNSEEMMLLYNTESENTTETPSPVKVKSSSIEISKGA